MNYIRFHEAEKLFTMQPSLENLLKTLTQKLKIAINDHEPSDEYIYGMCFNKNTSDVPSASGKINDSTYNIAINYSKMQKYECTNMIKSLKEDIFKLTLVLDKFNIAFRRLSPLQQKIIKLFYWERLDWVKIIAQINKTGKYVSKRHAKELKKSGIEELANNAKVTIEAYNEILQLADEYKLFC